jgi:hypothetical protein
MINFACAQGVQLPRGDSTSVSPGTFVITAKVISATSTDVTFSVIEVNALGHGLISPPAQGQQVTVVRQPGSPKLKAGEIMRIHLRESMGVDNSRSTYEIMQVSKPKLKS